MKAIVLAAGRGLRLWPYTAERPKCLLSIGPGSILDQQLANLEEAGVEEAVLVCGFGVDLIQQAVAARAGRLAVRLLYNPCAAVADNLISLWAARCEMVDDFLLLNGDNVFHPGLLPRILAGDDACSLLTARKPDYDDDDMKVQLRGDRLVRIGKGLPPAATDAESVGILRFAGTGVALLRQALDEIVQEDGATRRCFLDSVQHLVDRGHAVVSRDAGALACADVDTPEDLRFVRQHPHLFRAPAAQMRAPGLRRVGSG